MKIPERGYIMKKITLKIDGMMCGMCESHVNDAIRRAFRVKKVSSSHAKGETVVLTEEDIAEEQLACVLAPTGYKLLKICLNSQPHGCGLRPFWWELMPG